MPSNWIAVASAEHARRGYATLNPGFMQVGHGKLAAPLKKIAARDRVAYYSPATVLGGKDGLQSFVSIGTVLSGEPYTFDMGNGFVPYRLNVCYVAAKEVSILPLLDQFEFVEDRKRWGYKFRFGLFKVSDADMRRIAQAMQADLRALDLETR